MIAKEQWDFPRRIKCSNEVKILGEFFIIWNVCFFRSTSKLSSVELSSQTKTHWPNPTIVKIFLPQFKLVSREHLGKKYRLNGVVARGAFGQVYKAIDVDEQREYAIKVLSKAQVIIISITLTTDWQIDSRARRINDLSFSFLFRYSF